MDRIVEPGPLAGEIAAVASKSEAHRLLVCAAFADGVTSMDCATSSADIDATAGCLEALGARVTRMSRGFRVVPVPDEGRPAKPVLDCNESGSTLRFLLPVACALGAGSLTGRGRLPQRPLSPLFEELIAHGAALSPQGQMPLRVGGRLRGGRFELPGNVSSQYVTGLLLAAPLVDDEVEVAVAEPVESRPYIDLTLAALERFGVEVAESKGCSQNGAPARVFRVEKGQRLTSPGAVAVGGDWSNAAFWLAAGALSPTGVAVRGLALDSAQGDRAILAALALMGARVQRSPQGAACQAGPLRAARIDVRSCPDLVPPLAAVAAVCEGQTRITGAARLRLKESDRLATVSAAVNALGGHARVEGEGDLVVEGASQLAGGSVDAANDHRIAMMAAVMAGRALGPVTIHGAECVAKSYPAFFDDLALLGGRSVCPRS